MKMQIDLHTHTTASDGRDTPAEVVRKAAETGLCAIAITDHDTLDGLAEAQTEGQRLGLEVIRGCELSVHSEQGEVHILALWVPHEAAKLEEALGTLREHRAMRNMHIVEGLQKMGVAITYDEVLAVAYDRETITEGDTPSISLGRPHIAAVLLQKGYVSSVSEAFSKYLGSDCPAYVAKKLLDVKEVMALLREAQATICLAHPGLIKCSQEWLEKYIVYLQELGLHGLEVYHSTHDEAMTDRLLALTKKYNLSVSGGSDYHGASKPTIFLGCGKGNLRLGVEILDGLKEQRRQLGYPI